MGLLSEVADFGKDVIDDREKWADRFQKVGHFIERNAKGERLERVAKFGRALGDFSGKFTDFFESSLGRRMVKSARSPILAAGQHVITGMKLTTGIGDPENGRRFGEGANQLSTAGRTLSDAYPGDGWHSGASSAYLSQNSEQVTRTQALIHADQVVAAVLSREAEQIAMTREHLDSEADWLGDMSLVTMATGLIPYVGRAAQITAEIAMVTKAVGESTDQFMMMRDKADENAAEVRDALGQYEAVAGDATSSGEAPGFDPDAADGSDQTSDEHLESDPENNPDNNEDARRGGPAAVPYGAGGVAGPSGGAGGGAPASSPAAGPMAAPTTVASSPGLGTPNAASAAQQPGATAAGDAAGMLGSVMGAMLGPLGGIVGGVVQAAGQAVQAATQAGAQAAQLAGQAAVAGAQQPDNVELAEDSDRDGGTDDEESDKDGDNGDVEGKETEAQPREREGTGGAGAGADGRNARADTGSGTDSAGEDDKKTPMTLPPDLQAASALDTGAGPAPVPVGTDFEHSQLRMPAAATLDPGVPGSAAARGT
ncbi:hypothetical protein KL953_18100 [Mycolicibacterium goodii]|uniref:EspA/EspE family type VII secretion system effector n=1 Tax=Mycolicibacterium goodii TaxID=134601 RepID=UPI001BDC63FD|nr:EspA/EspE family type VII secretion system effector [Mycolicibacterium goodii]MBU8810798.1 hypothetical protein [Mycolicibacterium goodii]